MFIITITGTKLSVSYYISINLVYYIRQVKNKKKIRYHDFGIFFIIIALLYTLFTGKTGFPKKKNPEKKSLIIF